MRDGWVVVGRVTGTHLLEDIRVTVPYQVAVTIPAEQVYRSKDLHIALQQNKIHKLRDFREAPTGEPPATVAAKERDLQQIQADNLKLRAELEESNKQASDLKAELTEALVGQKGQLDAIQATLAGFSPASQQVVAQDLKPANEAVGGETPMFLPDISQAATNGSIKAKTQVSESDRVKEASAKLRQLRGKK